MIGVLPRHWIGVRLSDVCEINPRGKPDLAPRDEVTFVPMAAVSDTFGIIAAPETRTLETVQKGFTPFREGDVLFAKITPCMENGKAAIARDLVNQCGYGSTEFHVLRPSGLVLAEWLLAIIRTAEFRRAAASTFQGAVGQQRVPASFLEGFRIPLPPLSEQQRLVEILQEAEAIRRLRAEAEAKTAELLPTVFRDIFGTPERWKAKAKLGNLVRIVGGGTPSRTVEHFYSGDIPWATPKDIKSLYLDDTEEHVSDEAVQSSATNVVPAQSVLVVVKSKILAHSLPAAIIQVPMCFGQDIKALIPSPEVIPEFVSCSLQAQLGRILSRARGANTEGLTLEALNSLEAPELDPDSMERFRVACEEIQAVAGIGLFGDRVITHTLRSIAAYAFSGQLTATWREANAKNLATEASERDAALEQSGGTLSRAHQVGVQRGIVIAGQPMDRTHADLNREQHELLLRIHADVSSRERGPYFSAESLSQSLDCPLRRNPQAIEGHLAVLAARGLVIPLSLEEQAEDTGGYVFGNAYRLPRQNLEPGDADDQARDQSGDQARGSELERLAALLEQQRTEK